MTADEAELIVKELGVPYHVERGKDNTKFTIVVSESTKMILKITLEELIDAPDETWDCTYSMFGQRIHLFSYCDNFEKLINHISKGIKK